MCDFDLNLIASHEKIMKDTSSRDARICLVEPGHYYLIDGQNDYTSVTQFKSRWFKTKYNEEKHALSRQEKHGGTLEEQKSFVSNDNGIKQQSGIHLHKWIENFYTLPGSKFGDTNARFYELYMKLVESGNGASVCPDPEEKTWKQFLAFVKSNGHWECWRSEWRIFDERYKLAGTIDAFFRIPMPDGTFRNVLCDWKRFTSIRFESNSDIGCPEKFPDIIFPDTNYWQTHVQLNLYRIPVVERYRIPVDYMIIVRFGDTCHNFQIHIVEADDRLSSILKSI
jgi:hypothetical protein